MANLNIGYWNNENKFNLGSIVDANFDGTVDDLKLKVIEKLELHGKEIDVMYAGIFLDGKSTLKECRLKPDNVVHIIVKKPPVVQESVYDNLDPNIEKHVTSFRLLNTKPGYKRYVEKINNKEIYDELVTTVPGLVDDPVGITLLKHPELLVTCTTDDAVRRVIGEHPSLVLGITRLMNVIQSELSAELGYPFVSAASYLPEIYYYPESDDDDSEPQVIEPLHPLVTQPPSPDTPPPFITLSEFAALVANSMAQIENQPEPPAASSSDPITPEMISNTIGQSLANVVGGSGAAVAQGEMITLSKLRQMSSYGCPSDAVNVRALQLANGDVQAAINMVLSGAILQDM